MSSADSADSAGGRGKPIYAAGAAVWRTDPTAGPEILLVHRPKYDDWSLPKGKLEKGEHPLACAVREVQEETGHRIRLDRPLPTQRYDVDGRPKEVYYWAARADPHPLRHEPDNEIDRIAMLPVADAIARLSHQVDIDVVTSLTRGPWQTRTIIVLRHGHARSRDTWAGDDRDRPLDQRGEEEAHRLVPVMQALGVTAIVSSPAVRCRATVEPLAAALGQPVDLDDGLTEEGFAADGGASMRTRAKAAADEEVALLCTHRPVLPELLTAVHASDGIAPGNKLATGEFVVVNHRNGDTVASEQYRV